MLHSDDKCIIIELCEELKQRVNISAFENKNSLNDECVKLIEYALNIKDCEK